MLLGPKQSYFGSGALHFLLLPHIQVEQNNQHKANKKRTCWTRAREGLRGKYRCRCSQCWGFRFRHRRQYNHDRSARTRQTIGGYWRISLKSLYLTCWSHSKIRRNTEENGVVPTYVQRRKYMLQARVSPIDFCCYRNPKISVCGMDR